tara:strand:- start:402 stop:587 length:186 start_codon:yes stop_codon:yes gene_type:complete
MKFSYILFHLFRIAILVHSTDTFDDDGLTFQKDGDSAQKNATSVEENFLDVAMVGTNESHS